MFLFFRCFFVAMILGVLSTTSQAQTAESPTDLLVKKLRANLELASGKPFAIVVVFTSKHGMEKETEATLASITPLTRKEKGNITFDIHRDIDNPRVHYLYERWTNVDALAAHLKEPYITQAFGVYNRTLERELDVSFSTFIDVHLK
jgi:quinol monooxygenase YgiN